MAVTEKASSITLVVTGIVGGFISAMVKSGTEDIMPPRLPNEIPPPIQMLDAMGLHAEKMNYFYSQQAVNWGGNGTHIIFSIVTAIVYCFLARWNKVFAVWAGIPFGLIVALGFHGVILPVLGFGHDVFFGPAESLISEVLGSILWMWTIEVFCRYMVGKA